MRTRQKLNYKLILQERAWKSVCHSRIHLFLQHWWYRILVKAVKLLAALLQSTLSAGELCYVIQKQPQQRFGSSGASRTFSSGRFMTQVSAPKLGLCLILHPPSRAWGGSEELGVREWWCPWTVPILDRWLVWCGPPSEPLYWDTIRPSNINTSKCISPSFLPLIKVLLLMPWLKPNNGITDQLLV